MNQGKKGSISEWKGLNPRGISLSAEELCESVSSPKIEWQAMTLCEGLQAVEDMGELAKRLRDMQKKHGVKEG